MEFVLCDTCVRVRPVLLTLLLGLLFVQAWAQSTTVFPYHLDWRREATLLTAGASLMAAGHLTERDLPVPKLAELSSFQSANVWAFDRGATRQESAAAIDWSNHLLNWGKYLPVTLLASRPARQKGLVIATMLAESIMLNDGLTKTTKVVVKRARPYLYNPAFDAEYKMSDDARYSFFSGHTSHTAMLSFFTAKVFNDLYPQSRLRPFVWAGAALVPAATGLCRYLGGKHYPTDILTGYAVGAAVGILVPQLHKTPLFRSRHVRLQPLLAGGGAVGLHMVWTM